MRTQTRLFLLFIALILTLSACTAAKKAGTAEDIYAAMEKAGLLSPMIPMTGDELYDLTGIHPDLWDDGSLHQAADGLIADEILILHARDEAGANEIEKYLRARLESKAEEAKGYSPEQYAVIQKGVILRGGQDLCLIVSPQAEKLRAVYGEYR